MVESATKADTQLMPEPLGANFKLSVITTLIGGAIALTSVALAPTLTHWQSERANSQAMRIERFEEFIEAVYTHRAWLEIYKASQLKPESDLNLPDPIWKARAIASVHFPELLDALDQLEITSSPYITWMIERGIKVQRGNASSMNDGFEEAFRPYQREYFRMQQEIVDFASSRLK